jgi:hypothetical protein
MIAVKRLRVDRFHGPAELWDAMDPRQQMLGSRL